MKVSLTPFVAISVLILALFAGPQLHAGFYLEGGVKRVRIPVEIQNNVVLLPVRVNNSFEMHFILDTGAKTTILTEPTILPFLNVKEFSEITVKGLGRGKEIKARLARDIKIAMPGAKGSGINMVVMPEDVISYSGMFGKPVYGIIGFDLFGQFTVEINYQGKYIILHNPFFHKPPKGKKWQTIPIELRQAKPYVTASLENHEGNVITDTWLLDTGASMAISLFRSQLTLPNKSVQSFLGKGLTGEVHGHLGRNPIFKIGDYELKDIVTGYPDEESLAMFPEEMNWYGNIGSDVMSRFKVVFDYFNNKVYLKKNSDFKKPFDYNNSGLEIITLGAQYENFMIAYVRPNSPAAKAGVQKNDVLMSVNGSPVSGMKIDQVYGDLIRREGKAVRLKLRRGQKIIKTRFVLVREI
ncbi:MAG: PDZ domain-containing protein [Bacteroidota bacterium]